MKKTSVFFLLLAWGELVIMRLPWCRLEADYQGLQTSVVRAMNDGRTAAARLTGLRADNERAREALSMG